MSKNDFILEAVDIHKSFKQAKNELHVLRGVDLTVRAGEIVAIVGPSGAGKSTFLHILGGLDVPDKGVLNCEGTDVYRLNDPERADFRNKSAGFVFQFYHLLPEFTALENVLLPVLIKHDCLKNKRLEEQAAAMLEKVGLKTRLTHKPYQLSGGEQQRVAIARALVNEPRVVFCDEPTGNLDSATGHETMDLLISLNKKNRQTVILVTHDEAFARMAERIIYMKDGMLIEHA